MSKVNIKVNADILKSSKGEFLQGRVQFYSKVSDGFISHLLDNKIQIPTVNCSRDGSKCATPVTELEAHNHHVPVFSSGSGHTELDMVNYSQRIIKDTIYLCEEIEVGTDVSGTANLHTISESGHVEKTEPTTFDVGNEELIKCEDCGSDKDVDVYKSMDQEAVLCPSCITKAEHLAQQAYDEAKDEGKTDDNAQ